MSGGPVSCALADSYRMTVLQLEVDIAPSWGAAVLRPYTGGVLYCDGSDLQRR